MSDKFWNRVKIGEPDECWPWTGEIDSSRGGYGRFWVSGGRTDAHRHAWELANQACIIPGRKTNAVAHNCDNPPCCNPTHLSLGSHSDNQHDKVRKGRQLKGSQIAGSKLTPKTVERIRLLRSIGLMPREIAPLFNISARHVRKLVSKFAWKHL